MAENNFIDLCSGGDIPVQGSRRINLPTINIAVFRTIDNRYFAIEDQCPHQGGPLSEGIVHDGSVTCPLHNEVIDLQSGKSSEEGEKAVKCFPVELRETRVFIDLSTVMIETA